jgi:SpoIID/LytB domain protein
VRPARLFLALALVAVATPTTQFVASAAAPAVADVVLDGHGNGHGYGLSQWGAYGYAVDRGWSAARILDHYYGGTVAGTVPAATLVGVRLQRLDDLQTAVVSESGGLVVDGVKGGPWKSVLARETTQGMYRVWVRSDAQVCPAASGDPVAAGWTLVSTAVSAQVNIHAKIDTSLTTSFADLPAVCEPNGTVRSYRGFIRAVNGSVGENRTVNVVPLEQYLRAVIAKEMSPSWATAGNGRGLQALEAQAIAARSFPLSSRWYTYADVCDSTCQAYFGAATRSSVRSAFTRVEYPSTDAAVAATRGVVRRVGSTAGPIALTMFAASTGGWTIKGTVPTMPFPAVADAGDSTPLNPYYRWTVTLSASRIQSAYPSIGTFTGLKVLTRNGLGDWGGRVLSMSVTGRSGSVTVTGDQFRRAMGLRSNWFTPHVAPVDPCAGRAAPPAAPLPAAAASRFTPSTPRRLIDTRNGTGTAAVPLGAGCTMVVRPKVAAHATAVAVNVTSVAPSASGFLVAFPCGVARPAASTVQMVAGRVVAGMTVVRLAVDGSFCLYSSAVSHVVVDLAGAYAPGIGAKFQPIAPVRLIDTRSVSGLLPAGSVLTVPTRGPRKAGAAATAVALTVHAVGGKVDGVVVVDACGAAAPAASSLRVTAGISATNHMQVRTDTAGAVCIRVSSPMEIVVDLSGWFGNGATTEYHPMVPRRVVDTRSGLGGHAGALKAATDQRFTLAGRAGLPAAATLQSVLAGITVVAPTASGAVTVHACASRVPPVSMVRYAAGVSATTAVVGLDDSAGRWCVYPTTAVQVVIDVGGWFA